MCVCGLILTFCVAIMCVCGLVLTFSLRWYWLSIFDSVSFDIRFLRCNHVCLWVAIDCLSSIECLSILVFCVAIMCVCGSIWTFCVAICVSMGPYWFSVFYIVSFEIDCLSTLMFCLRILDDIAVDHHENLYWMCLCVYLYVVRCNNVCMWSDIVFFDIDVLSWHFSWWCCRSSRNIYIYTCIHMCVYSECIFSKVAIHRVCMQCSNIRVCIYVHQDSKIRAYILRVYIHNQVDQLIISKVAIYRVCI